LAVFVSILREMAKIKAARKIQENNMLGRFSSHRKGFTLIELLVVIAIIALLAAILFPVFARARENARKSSCANNLKQIALAAAQYTQDYDEMSIPIRTGGAGTPAFSWTQLVVPYTKSSQILICPSAAGRTQTYTYNFNVGFGPRAIADIPLPAQTPSYVDAFGSTAIDNLDHLAFITPSGTSSTNGGYGFLGRSIAVGFTPGTAHGDNWRAIPMGYRHLDGANYAFVDGHVKWLPYTAAVQGSEVPTNTTTNEFSKAGAKLGLDYNCDGQVGGPGVTPANGSTAIPRVGYN
jgi:prepilin-type N-terminal cleavage/methylation domain-containing protein/prepilin-type processing-associated H-X9-DG protein